MKLKVILFLVFGILLISLTVFSSVFVSAIPYILFVNPTPADGYRTTSSGEVVINSTLNNISSLTELIWNWDSVNYSLYDEDLVLMYNFENNSLIGENDALVVDVSRGGNNGSVINGNNISVGKYGNAQGFNGSNYIDIPDSEEFNFTNELTLSLWVNTGKERFVNVVTGPSFTCGHLDNGKVYCWGRNNYGQLGDGSFENKYFPTPVKGDYNFSKIYGGFYHVCGLLHNGSALCWGDNQYGGLGLGNGNTTHMNTPQFVTGGYNFSILTKSGESHTCGLLHNGSALCWGGNYYAQLGLGPSNRTYMYSPTFVYGGYVFKKLNSSEDSPCGILDNGSALCWGQGKEGQVGNGAEANVDVPTPVMGGYNFTLISGGEDSNMGLLTNGSILGWGGGVSGQLGIGLKQITYTPTLALGDLTFKSIDHTGSFSCGVLTNGSVVCSGNNAYSQLGLGPSNTTAMSTFQFILGGYNFSSVSVGGSHACGLLHDGSILCWGYNAYGQLAQGSSIFLIPTPTLKSYSFELSLSTTSSCGLLDNGSAFCWGQNNYGQLGIGSLESKHTPTPVAGNYQFKSLKTKTYHVCGLLHNGSALCWGYNPYGGLGNGDNISRSTPTFVSGNHNFSSIYLGNYDTCGILQNGSILCWGNNNYGQLGNGSAGHSYFPVFMPSNYNFTSLSLGTAHSCGLMHNGSRLCWGRNNYGQLGIGNTTTMFAPVFTKGNHTFKDIEDFTSTTCGLLENGSALCWGYNPYGQIGNGNITTMYTPKFVLGGNNFTSLYTGSGSYACGLLENGSALCWGYNNLGQLGNGSDVNNYVPTFVYGNYNFTSLSLGSYHTCGILQNGSSLCWGDNEYGKTGFFSREVKLPIRILKENQLLGKGFSSYSISSTYDGRVFSSIGNVFLDSTSSYNNWINVVSTYNNSNGEMKLYINGELNNTLNIYDNLAKQPSNFYIGKDSNSIIDEVRVYNRSLSASEVNQLYRSNLKKINNSAWEFYATESLNSGDKTYSYSLFALEGGTSFKVLRSIIKYTFYPEEEEDENSGSGSTGPPSRNSFKRGYSTNVMENSTINIPIGDSSNTIVVVIRNINPDSDKITLSVNDTDYEINLNETSKIDLDKDGYYDIEVFNRKNYGKVSNLEFKSIHEKIKAEEQEEVIEEVEEEQENNETNESTPEFENKVTWFRGFISGVGIIVLVVIILLTHVKVKRKKRYKKFGY